MIRVHSAPEIKSNPKGGWEVIYWVGDAFDEDIPFRTILAEMAEILCEDPASDLRLPPYEYLEDFVEGTIHFETIELQIYYEWSLGFLDVRSDSPEVLAQVIERLRPSVIVA